jgi:hypothetical protein
MKRSLALVALSSVAFLACSPDPGEVCGVSGVIPEESEVALGRGEAMQDGAAFSGGASWAPGPNSSLDIGTLSIIIGVDESGTATADLIERGAFPICVPVGERDINSGSAQLVGTALVSDASHTGGVAILAESGGVISGRFAVDLADTSGGTTSFTDGVFRAERR